MPADAFDNPHRPGNVAAERPGLVLEDERAVGRHGSAKRLAPMTKGIGRTRVRCDISSGNVFAGGDEVPCSAL